MHSKDEMAQEIGYNFNIRCQKAFNFNVYSMKLSFVLLLCFILPNQPSHAQESASTILKQAYQQARIENKNVFVIFHASWCGWCKKMDAKMNDESCKELFERNYIIAHLVVNESKKNKHLENEGAIDLYNEQRGEGTGIPFWLIYDQNGILLENSLDSNGKNIGCPATGHEVAEFEKILRKTSDLSDDEIKVIANLFKEKQS